MCILFELVEGGSLYNYIHNKDRELPLTLAVRIALDVAHAMAYLHHGLSPSVLHRDLKSPNVLLTRDGAEGELLAPVVAKVCGKLTRWAGLWLDKRDGSSSI